MQQQPTDWFEDVTDTSGVSFTYWSGSEGKQYAILESIGGGVALVDYDCDGDLDLVFPGGGSITKERVEGLPAALFRNEGDWTFTAAGDVTGIGIPSDYSHGAFAGDYNADGFADVWITCYGRSLLFRNEGDGTFSDVTESAGLSCEHWSTAAAWADYDKDGHLDLYVGGYVDWSLERPQPVCGNRFHMVRDPCGPSFYDPIPDRLFRSLGDGRFREVSAEAGLRADGRALGVVAADLNADGWIDFFVANDISANHLYLGDGQLPFEEVGLSAGVAMSAAGKADGSMGVDVADINGDGRPEIFVTNMEKETNALYENVGDGAFSHTSRHWNLAARSYWLVGFGTCLADFDADGLLDIFVSNGHVFRNGVAPFRQPPLLHRNRDGQPFDDVSADGGPYFRSRHSGRGAAVGDLDNDGDLDLVISHLNEPVALLRNQTDPGQSWIRVSLRGVKSHRDAIGAVVSLCGGRRTVAQWKRSGAGYFSTFDPRLIFSADGPSPVTVSVRWSSGDVELFRDLEIGETHELVEGSSHAEHLVR